MADKECSVCVMVSRLLSFLPVSVSVCSDSESCLLYSPLLSSPLYSRLLSSTLYILYSRLLSSILCYAYCMRTSRAHPAESHRLLLSIFTFFYCLKLELFLSLWKSWTSGHLDHWTRRCRLRSSFEVIETAGRSITPGMNSPFDIHDPRPLSALCCAPSERPRPSS